MFCDLKLYTIRTTHIRYIHVKPYTISLSQIYFDVSKRGSR